MRGLLIGFAALVGVGLFFSPGPTVSVAQVGFGQVDPKMVFRATAAESGSAVFVQIDDSGDLEVFDPTDDRPAVGFVAGAFNTSDVVTVYRWGLVQGLSGLPTGQRIYAGRNGKPTWGNASAAKPEADDDVSANRLGRDDWVQEIGYSVDGTDLWFDCRQPAIRRAG